MKKILFAFSALLINFGLLAQYSITASTGLEAGLGTEISSRNTINLGLELPESESHTLKLGFNYFLPIKNIDRGTINAELKPEYTGQGSSIISVPITENISQYSFSFGRRNYILNTYDDGLSFYYGSNTRISMVNDVIRIGEFDTEKYFIPEYNVLPGKLSYQSFLLGLGLSGGVKYQLAPHLRSAIFLDLLTEYNIMIYDKVGVYGSIVSPINLSFRIGYRYDFF